jgi:uncharacterized membrane protein YkvA (DUF1232 family)
MPGVWWQLLIGVLGGLLLLWVALLVALWVTPDETRLRDLIRLLPDVVRLVTRLARDRTLPGGVRVRLWFLLGYLALPIDLVPDVIPVLGYADDAIVVVLALRLILQRAGHDALRRNWPGDEAGLAAVARLAG